MSYTILQYHKPKIKTKMRTMVVDDSYHELPKDPFQIAVLRKSVDSNIDCHRIPLKQLHESSSSILMKDIGFVTDDGKDMPTVSFKFGKIIYRLSVNTEDDRPWLLQWLPRDDYAGTVFARISEVLQIPIASMKVRRR